MFEGDTLNRFGKKFPRPFIEKIILKPNSQIDVLISMFFEIPALDEEAELFINQLETNQDILLTVSLCSSNKFNEAVSSGNFLILGRDQRSLGASISSSGNSQLIFKTFLFSDLFTNSDDAEVQIQNDIFNSEGKRFLKLFSTVNFTADTESYEYVTSFTRNRDADSKVVGFSNANFVRSQTSDLIYERVFNPDGTVNRDPIQSYQEQSGVFYYQTPLASLQMTYHKTDDFGHKDIINAVGAINQKYSNDESNNISYILSEFSDSPRLFVRLQRALDNFTDKTRVSDVGKLYNEISAYIVQTNPLITAQSRLEKRQFSNIKVKDLRREPVPLDTTSRTESTNLDFIRSTSTFFPEPVISRSLKPLIIVPDYVDGSYLEIPLDGQALANPPDDAPPIDINRYFKLVTNGYFFFDYEKALNYKSEISTFLNPYNIQQIFGRGALGSFFKIKKFEITKTKLLYGGDETLETRYIYDPQNQTCDRYNFNESYKSINVMNFKASPGESTTGTYEAEGMGGAVGSRQIPVLRFYKFKEETYDTLVAQRGFDTLEGLGGYRLACFELNDYESYGNIMEGLPTNTTTHLDRKLKTEIEITDRTMNFYDTFIKDKIHTVRDNLRKYLNFADDFCSYNNIDGRFNDFFVSAIKNEFDSPYPWEEAPLFFTLFQQMLKASYHDSGLRRRAAALIDMETAKKTILEEISLISPETGTLEDLQFFYEQLDTFVKENFTKGSGLDSGNRIYLEGMEASSAGFSNLQNPVIQLFMSREDILYGSDVIDTFEVDELDQAAADVAATTAQYEEDVQNREEAKAAQELLAKCENYQLLWHKRQKNLFSRASKVKNYSGRKNKRQEYHNGLSPKTQDWIDFQNDKEKEFTTDGCDSLGIGEIGQISRERLDPDTMYDRYDLPANYDSNPDYNFTMSTFKTAADID